MSTYRTSYSEGLALARELAPLLARIPRAVPPVPRATDSRSLGTPATDHGRTAAFVHVYLDLPAPREADAAFAAHYGLPLRTFRAMLSVERRLRTDAAFATSRARMEGGARQFLAQHRGFSIAARDHFARTYGFPVRAFRHACLRVAKIDALRAAHPALAAPHQAHHAAAA